MSSNAVHLFWDNSNIFIPAKYVAEQREGPHAYSAVRIQFENLYRLAHGGRRVEHGVCVGSVPPDLGRVFSRLEQNIRVEQFERGAASGREQGVDQCLQVHMLRAACDHPPSVAVLLSGDGAGYENGHGFRADLERLAIQGWSIEVLAWKSACNRYLREFAESNGAFVALDDFYSSITFIERGRYAMPLSLVHRRFAPPPPADAA